VANIDELSFGSIVVGGKEYSKDALVFAGGKVKKRKGGFLIFSSHEIKRQEIEEFGQDGTEVAIVGIEPTALPAWHLS
jgi:hypothetical protein